MTIGPVRRHRALQHGFETPPLGPFTLEPERLVLTFTDQTSGDGYELVTVVLTDLGDGRTQMDFAQTGGHLAPEEYEQAGQGWSGFFDDMAARLGGG